MLKNAQARIQLEGRLKYSDYGISKFDCHPWNFSTWNTLMVHGGNSWGFYSLESLISDENTYYTWVKYKAFSKIVWIWSHHLHIHWKFKFWAGKFAWGVKANYCWALSTNFWKQKVCWHHPVMFCIITSSKLSCQ